MAGLVEKKVGKPDMIPGLDGHHLVSLHQSEERGEIVRYTAPPNATPQRVSGSDEDVNAIDQGMQLRRSLSRTSFNDDNLRCGSPLLLSCEAGGSVDAVTPFLWPRATRLSALDVTEDPRCEVAQR